MLFGFDEPSETQGELAHEPPAADPSASAHRPWLYVALGLCAGLAIAFGTWALWPSDDQQLTAADVDSAIDDALEAQSNDSAAGTVAYNQIAPSLVAVRAIHDDDPETEHGASNLGSGIVINDQGQILTANHVIAGADSIEVVFPDGSTTTARLDSNDTEMDIAVLSPNGITGVTVPAVMGNSRTLQIGDPIFAVGSPLGLTGTLSAGVISALNRNIPFPGDTEMVLSNLIQFDAAVNQGSSGGPLLNTDGQVIGIVTALADPAGQGFFIGIGFAVPIDIAAGGTIDGPSQ